MSYILNHILHMRHSQSTLFFEDDDERPGRVAFFLPPALLYIVFLRLRCCTFTVGLYYKNADVDCLEVVEGLRKLRRLLRFPGKPELSVCFRQRLTYSFPMGISYVKSHCADRRKLGR